MDLAPWLTAPWLTALLALVVPVTADGPWASTLDVLDARRTQAYARLDADLLGGVYAQGSPLLAVDHHTIASYRARGLRLDRVSLELLDVEVLRRRRDDVRLRVVDVLEPVRVRRPGGAWSALPQDLPTERRIHLVRTARGWRIADAVRTAG